MNLPDYLNWHFSQSPIAILKLTRNLIIFCENFFGISLHLKTLFSPWKRQIFDSKPGFDITNFFEAVISNIISSLLGAVVRLCVITVGIVSQIVILVAGMLFCLLFIFLPLATLPLYYHQKSKELDKAERHSLYKLLADTNLPLLSSDEVKKLSKTKVGSFLFSRLQIPKNSAETKSLEELITHYNLKKNDIKEVLRWFCHAKDEEEEYAASFDLNNMLRIPTIGKDWAYGYSLEFDKYTNNLIYEAYSIPHLIGRNNELMRIKLALSKDTQKNALLVGDPGSGRHALVLAFTLDVFENKAGDAFKNREVVEINLNILVSEAKVATEIKGKVTRILDEAIKSGNKIITIDNFDRFINGENGTVNLSDVFIKVFERSDIQLIAITSNEAYHRVIEPNSELAKLFETVSISEISTEDTLKILEHLTPILEYKYNVFIPFQILVHTISVGNMIGNIPFPEKAIDVLSEASLYAKTQNQKLVTLRHVDTIISQKTKVPTGQLLATETEILKNIEVLLKKQVVGQDEAITKIAQSLRRARLNIKGKGKPIGTFLFLGPTGVGKTETAKALARSYFGSEKQMIRIDMNQYQGESALPQLLGNTKSNEPGFLVKAVRETPFTVILLDELEKASQEVVNLLLTILDEGYITDSFGRKVSFENTLIIATSNAASEEIRKKIAQTDDPSTLSQSITESVLSQKIFSPELINRFDAVVVYKPLDKENLNQIATLLLTSLNKQLEEKRLKVNITEELKNSLVNLGHNPQFGARPMRRVIQEKVEDYIALGILENKFKEDELITIPQF